MRRITEVSSAFQHIQFFSSTLYYFGTTHSPGNESFKHASIFFISIKKTWQLPSAIMKDILVTGYVRLICEIGCLPCPISVRAASKAFITTQVCTPSKQFHINHRPLLIMHQWSALLLLQIHNSICAQLSRSFS